MEKLPECSPERLKHFPLHQPCWNEWVALHLSQLLRGPPVGAQGNEVVRPPCHSSLASSFFGEVTLDKSLSSSSPGLLISAKTVTL